MTSKGVRRGVSSRPQHPRVPQYSLHHHLWITAQALAPVPQEHGHGGPSIMERFKRMAPPSFKGESQPLLAESWMREVKKIFRAIRSRLVAFDHRTQDEALNASCRQESKMDHYLDEKRAAQKRFVPPFQRQVRKKAVY
ncbi:hypothetical protein Taro_052547 [Colocasia esculenta]|uniref:Uncharacterized protein n=1 Tax=Colocasia esculenta TaxID=4460 RepID=A0A843XK41_COLES|nr:hypothetical protein [Colocasia esculenta]